MLAIRRQKSKTSRESWEEALEKAGLATQKNHDAILQHPQSLSVKLCIVFLGGKSALEQVCLDRILQCKDLKHALPAFTILANAQEGIKDDQVVGIMLDRAPESRKEAAHALRRLQESHLLTDKFKKAVEEDSWDGSERNQASSAIKAINTLISRDTKENLVTEAHLRAVLRHDLPASVAEIIVDCYQVAGTEFIAQYMPSILRLNDIETEWLSSTIECLREHEVLTAGTVKGIFECCHIGSQEASKGDNARLKLHDDFTFSLFYDCVAHMDGCSFKDFSALVTQLKDPAVKLTNLPNLDQLKNPAFNLINLPNMKRLIACFNKCPDMQATTEFKNLLTKIPFGHLRRHFEEFTEECVTGEGNAAENAKAYFAKMRQRAHDLAERKAKVGQAIEERIKKVAKLSLLPKNFELSVTNLLREDSLRRELSQTQAVIAKQMWQGNEDIYKQDAFSKKVQSYYLVLSNVELKEYIEEYIENKKETTIVTEPALQEAAAGLVACGFFTAKDTKDPESIANKRDKPENEASCLGIEAAYDHAGPADLEAIKDDLIAACEREESYEDFVARIIAATEEIKQDNLARVAAIEAVPSEDESSEEEAEAIIERADEEERDRDFSGGNRYRP